APGAAGARDASAADPPGQAGEHGADQVVIDCVGGYRGSACRALRARGGRHVMVAGDKATEFAQAVIAPLRSRLVLGRTTTARLSPLVEAIARGALRIHIVDRLPLTDAEEAHARSRSGRTPGKIVLLPSLT